MFLNLTPYLTWLGIMLTNKPNDLQSKINVISQPSTIPTPPSTLVTTTVRPSSTIKTTQQSTSPSWDDVFICSGRPPNRYAHRSDCTKYFDCTSGQSQIVRPTVCPSNLHFSPALLLCTLPEDADCTIMITASTISGGNSSVTPSPALSTTTSSSGTWLRRIQAANYYNPANEDHLLIYYDNRVLNPQNISWPITFIRDMWQSIISMYGNFGAQNRLYVVLRGSQLSEELSYSSYLDSDRGHVNAIEVGSSDWSLENSTNTDRITRNLAGIVSKNARGIRYQGVEPYWPEILVYDFYRAEKRTQWRSHVIQNLESDNFASIPLFSQWYLPIYEDYGGGSVLNRFFIVREQNFPKATGDNSTFARTMNLGEFVHFWSGTTGANLTGLARVVFGWSDSLDRMYQQAAVDFGALNY